jgi:dynein heavy chain, axonemal
LIDDDDLIDTLRSTKLMSTDVKHKLQIATEKSQKINLAREEYRPVAARASILYFLIVEMSFVNIMYQTSLKQFLHLFQQGLQRSPRVSNNDNTHDSYALFIVVFKSLMTVKRLSNIIEYLTYDIYQYAVRGYYEEHKFMFTLLLALKIDLHAGRIKFEEFQMLIKGGTSLDTSTSRSSTCANRRHVNCFVDYLNE